MNAKLCLILLNLSSCPLVFSQTETIDRNDIKPNVKFPKNNNEQQYLKIENRDSYDLKIYVRGNLEDLGIYDDEKGYNISNFTNANVRKFVLFKQGAESIEFEIIFNEKKDDLLSDKPKKEIAVLPLPLFSSFS